MFQDHRKLSRIFFESQKPGESLRQVSLMLRWFQVKKWEKLPAQNKASYSFTFQFHQGLGQDITQLRLLPICDIVTCPARGLSLKWYHFKEICLARAFFPSLYSSCIVLKSLCGFQMMDHALRKWLVVQGCVYLAVLVEFMDKALTRCHWKRNVFTLGGVECNLHLEFGGPVDGATTILVMM
jgi:hypothetical protein